MKACFMAAFIVPQLVGCADDQVDYLSARSSAANDHEAPSDETMLDENLSLSKNQCTPTFGPYAGGSFGNWMGADAAYSVRLKNGKTLWFFGNTFMKFGELDRHNAAMIANTIAVSSCVNGKFKIT